MMVLRFYFTKDADQNAREGLRLCCSHTICRAVIRVFDYIGLNLPRHLYGSVV